ncbi:thioesterase family protein [Flavicella sp.]|uniref:acyl-CoA thioesterase n=1 Tax=Flavicella sp. TaxID=2957742 RepID=UPI0026370D30|nr:thioesterase family protein [Flavicella sp.]MDG1806057.1 thioesterase family protein [Flavicella sp.]
MIENNTSFKIRYAETDQMGYAHHGNYAQYFEIGRLELLHELGISYKKMEEEGLILPVYSINTRFIQPAKFDDTVRLRTILKEIPTARITFEYEIYNAENKKISTGETVLVFVDTKKNRPIKIPQNLLSKIMDKF